jgi:hypothetical protein
MAGVDGRNRGLELLPVAARVHHLVDIEVAKDRQACGGIGQPIVGLLEGLQADVVAGGGRKLLVAEVADVGHPTEADVGGVGHQAGDDGRLRWARFPIASEHVLEGRPNPINGSPVRRSTNNSSVSMSRRSTMSQ